MPTKMIAGKNVQVSEEGYLTNPAEWTRELAVELAKEEGIGEQTLAHPKVIECARLTASQDSGAAPTLRTITSKAGVITKELFTLLPKEPTKKVAKIAGLGKPEGCV